MDFSFSTYLLYFLGIAMVLVGGAGGAFIYQITGIRLQRPRIKPISREELPAYLLPLYEDAAAQLSALGFKPHHFALSQDVIVHDHAARWCMVMVNRYKITAYPVG